MPHPDMTSADEVSITEVYLITSKEFTRNAKDALIEKFSDSPVFFIDGESVLEKVKEYEIPITEEEKLEKSVSEAINEEKTPAIAEFAGEKYKIEPVSEEEEVT